MNSLTEHDFQNAFKKNCRSDGNSEQVQKRASSTVMVTSRPKVSSGPHGSISPENYGCVWYQVFTVSVPQSFLLQ
jgi:hypothetical protein